VHSELDAAVSAAGKVVVCASHDELTACGAQSGFCRHSHAGNWKETEENEVYQGDEHPFEEGSGDLLWEAAD